MEFFRQFLLLITGYDVPDEKMIKPCMWRQASGRLLRTGRIGWSIRADARQRSVQAPAWRQERSAISEAEIQARSDACAMALKIIGRRGLRKEASMR